jgi:hypothetical protein
LEAELRGLVFEAVVSVVLEEGIDNELAPTNVRAEHRGGDAGAPVLQVAGQGRLGLAGDGRLVLSRGSTAGTGDKSDQDNGRPDDPSLRHSHRSSFQMPALVEAFDPVTYD